MVTSQEAICDESSYRGLDKLHQGSFGTQGKRGRNRVLHRQYLLSSGVKKNGYVNYHKKPNIK